MILMPYRPFHLKAIEVQDAQSDAVGQIQNEWAVSLEQAGPAYTLMDKNIVLGCGGLVIQWTGRAMAWTLLSKELTGTKFLRAHKEATRFLNSQDIKRIEMVVDHEHIQGHRWAEMLGFEWEGLMRGYSQFSQRDCDLYARIK